MIARVFPRRTNATPDDAYAFVGEPPKEIPADVAGVDVSCTFTYDRTEAERLAVLWGRIAPVKIGGPAYNSPAENFVPGRYLKVGYTITSRGCPNYCWFCSVSKREGNIRELPIVEGWNILDSNLLACSDDHILRVFRMLSFQSRKAEFTGGLEAKRLKEWHACELKKLKTKQMFFAYDTPDDWEPLYIASKMMWQAGFTPASKSVRAYVLIGFPKDTIFEAEKRLQRTLAIGVVPMAMLWLNEKGEKQKDWSTFQRLWARPAFMKVPKILL